MVIVQMIHGIGQAQEKTLTATVTGIAEQEGYLNINDKVSDYLGTGWTSAPSLKENLITNKHLLTMSSGLDDALGDDVSPPTYNILQMQEHVGHIIMFMLNFKM